LYSTKSDGLGNWSLKIETPNAGGPYELNISDGTSINLKNVMIGEVWVCSGQSNMEISMMGYNQQPVENSLDAIVKSKNKNIRVYTVTRDYDAVPKTNCEGAWEEAAPESVIRTSAVAYYFGRLINQTTNVPVGLIVSAYGGSSIRTWMSKESLSEYQLFPEAEKSAILSPKQSPTALFNAMINPLIGFGIRGVIWYQGEADRYDPKLYIKMFSSMVKDWRSKWGIGTFPFYYCQIAPYQYIDKYNSAFFREAQEKCMQEVPNTGMAVTLDSESPNCIHPSKKIMVGERLAYWALAEVYNSKGFPYKSPTVKNVAFQNNMAVLTFDNVPRGLTSYGKEVNSVVIAGEDKKWQKAIVSFKEDKMYVFSPAVKTPIAVRYAFQDYVSAEIFSVVGLPVSSFRTVSYTHLTLPTN
jgi:sialate O-acetylesterase